ncbi:unnamed protein product [Caenorhabditis angaria]|uniref:PH domain-containing protein n=1 Tax=Caenorhabditis angaria TaxID=860376 RepID=A0A9P1NAC2_9PELO|nr:unnamed protein product [Caenorhabditis angaria]
MSLPLPICEKCQSKKKCCQNYHLLYDDKVQIVKEITNSLPIDEEDNMSSDGLGLSPTSSRANIGLSQISVPLAWKSKETRTFSMFIVLQTRTRVIDTKIITHVDRNMTDVIIADSFIFDNEPEDFCVDILIYAARTDYGIENNMSNGSLRSRISRSLGRKFGASVKAQTSQANEPKRSPRFDQSVGGAHYNLLAKASLMITDASEEATIHNLRLSAFADLSGPPLYGHVICRMAVQPHSVLRPIAEGVLTVHHINADMKFDNVFSRLQGGHLQFFTVGDISFSSMETVLVIPLNRRSRVMATTKQLTLLLKTDETSDVPASTVYLEANTERAYETWRRALELQIYDIGVWGKFATSSTNLLYKKREDPVRETLSRAVGSNLYETISIKGSISKANFGGLSLIPCDGNTKGGIAATAPVKRQTTKQRANVIDLFQSPKAARKEEEPSNYVIQLNIGDDSVDNEYSAYSPLYTARPNSRHSRIYEEVKDGRRSWSKSIGSFIGRSSTATSAQITRL